MDVSDAKRLKQLEDENRELKQMLAEALFTKCPLLLGKINDLKFAPYISNLMALTALLLTCLINEEDYVNILIINHCSTNKGDKAVLEFITRELLVNGVNNITVSANMPEYCSRIVLPNNNEINVVPWAWNVSNGYLSGLLGKVVNKLRHVYYVNCYNVIKHCVMNGITLKHLTIYCNRKFLKALHAADLVISTGGHHVTSILAPNATSPQIFEMALAILADKPLYLWSQSIGPFVFSNNRNRLFIQKLLSKSAAIYVRDGRSLDELKMLGVASSNIYTTYESVFGFSDELDGIDKPSNRLPVVGISVYSVIARSYEEYNRYINSLCKIINHATGLGYSIKFFPMQLQGELSDDRPCIQQIKNLVDAPEKCSVYADCNSMLEHIRAVAKCRIFIGHKTHSVIMALLTGTPLLAIAYHPKTADFMSQFELSDNCIDDRFLDGEILIDMFDKIRSNMDIISDKEIEKSRQYGEYVRRDFAEMIHKV